jgi:group II intron reverse transcriptase/maturase
MQNAETVLSVLRDRGRRGLPVNELFRQLFSPQLYLLAYGRIYANHGAMTPGADGRTPDGMSMSAIEDIIDAMRHERYRFAPVKRTYIPKKNGKLRPLGLPSWSDKLVGEVVRLLLEAYYEPTFSDRSHGFRPGRGCHTALSEIALVWKGTTWFVEGDLSDFFGSLDHQVMLATLGEKIRDNRFLRLMRNMLEAGYLDDWEWHATLSGVPQGGVVSPVMSNIYLHKLDSYIETVLIPKWTRGTEKAPNPEYQRLRHAVRRARLRGDHATARELRKQARRLPSKNPHDPGYRRLRYCRYADDVLLGFTGAKAEAEQIKADLARFLRDDLALELNQDKTLVTHARTSAARFLGYRISVWHSDTKITDGQRSVNGKIRLGVPPEVIRAKAALYMKRGKPERRTELINATDYHIVATFGAEYRGLVQYYLLAVDVHRFTKLHRVMTTSMLKTLAAKHKSTVNKTAARHRATVATPHGPRTCLEARIERGGKQPLVARFGGIPLKRQKNAVLTDHAPEWTRYRKRELIRRLGNSRCELCKHTATVEVHQIRKLADLAEHREPQPHWVRLMAAMRRKTLIVCGTCHHRIHEQPVTTTT